MISSGDIPKSESVAIGFGSHRNNLDGAQNPTLVSTVESVASVVNLTEPYLARSRI